MLYIILLALIILIASVYVIPNRNERDEENIMEEVPSLKINKEELKKHAIEISNYSKVAKKANCRRMLTKSLDTSYIKILDGYDYLDTEAKSKNEVVPAAEWLLDNLYLIQREYKDIKNNMPDAYYKNLPVISRGSMKCYPRIYYIAVQLVSHTDGKIDEETIEAFVSSYQSNTVLTSWELWALPIMIKIALIQNISKITDRIVFIQKERKKADGIAERIIEASINENVEEEINKLSKEQITFTPKLIERLLKVIRDNGVENPIAYKWIDELLDSEETSAEKVITAEHQKEISYQASLGNSINSIREVGAINWRENFEKLSYVENILNKDPLHIYEQMDFQSRDYYRNSIEKLSKKVNMPESFIAKKVIECAEEAFNNEKLEEYKKHVGYYIIDDGVQCLKNKIKFDETGINTIESKSINKNVSFYIGSILLGTIVLTVAIVGISSYYDEDPVLWKYIIAALIILIPCSEIIISTFNWSVSKVIKPRYIPKIEFKDKIPEELSTIVVIPTLLDTELRVQNLINDMEVYYLANKEENLYFALLGDFKDSDKEHEEVDNLIVQTALDLVKRLNEKYSNNGKDIFYFFNRYRKYNSKEGIWIGWERKRGKLVEFNNLIRGDKNTSYNVISGDINNLSKVKYIITLDADTQLPRDSAKKLIGAMAHVLNRPYIDDTKKKVIRGHGLMQPRVSVGSLSANRTLFSRIFSGETGMDLYTNAISDVYEDLFDEGIFTGKGIYDVDVFINILKDEIPENSVLSHDLLEGSYIRAALVTDIELVDGYPAYYNSSSKRLHRWVRGDWQLLPWLFRKSPLNTLSKWKIVDNMRRSLLAPSIIILVMVSLIIFKNPDQWLIVAFVALLCPIFFDVSEIVVSPIRGISLSGKISSWKVAVEQFFLIFCFLPYQAYLMLDAVIRTLYRLYISKKHFLQWQTAADVEVNSGRKLKDFVATMWSGSLISILVIFMALRNSEEAVILMLPSCVIWFLSPWIAYSISTHIKDVKEDIGSEERTLLRRLGRKTWAYFEDFVASENNWLAPDNYQEDPSNGIATRTSPTNMGMGITSNLVAFDLGYIGILELVERISIIIDNMESLEKYNGHYYNWYDTKTKQPLYPRYISTVDSGNLIGYLWLTNQSLEDYLSVPIFNKNLAFGLLDTLKLANEELAHIDGMNNYYEHITFRINNEEFNLVSWNKFLYELWGMVIKLEEKSETKKLYWNTKLKEDIEKYIKELKLLYPWLNLITEKANDLSHFMDKFNKIVSCMSLDSFARNLDDLEFQLDEVYKSSNENETWIEEIKQLFENSKTEVNSLINKIEKLRKILDDISNNTDFKMLYNYKRQLFSIGYDVERDSLGNSFYDLLASESRQASFISIAKGEIEQSHWFRLGRSMTAIGKNKSLVSWSGTMFEYCMPLIIMRNYPNTLLEKTYISVVEVQKNYCKNRNVPWGISESAFYYFDVNSNYQYKAFGVPGLGLKRGLVNELVISPYSTVMALQIDFKDAVRNINKLIDIGMEGRYGFYEAIDYTKERLDKGREEAVVKCFMVHHQGMSLMSLDNVLNFNVLQERFHKIPAVKATELLLQERVPKAVVYDREQQYDSNEVINKNQSLVVRRYNTASTEMPESQLISNGTYSLMITNSGGGYAKKDDMMVYRWREDVTTDNTGMFFYIKNLNSNEYWSSAYEPCKYKGEEYEAIFSLDKVEFKRKDGNLRTSTEITVSNEDNAEVRRISITNNSDYTREIEITSYCEVTLAPYNADLVHPTFGNLFIKTEYLEEIDCIIANRRPRAKKQKRPWIMQTVALEGSSIGTTQYETNRANFIGRGRSLANPKAMDNDAQLKMTVGAVLDPIISMRVRVRIGKGETCRLAYTTAVADSKEEIIDLAKKYRDMSNIDRAFDLAWSSTQLELRYLGIKSTQANMYQLMASKILFLNTSFKKRHEYIVNLGKGQSALWSYGISGDVPIVLLIIKEEHHVDLVRQLINAHEYWNTKGLKVDLVIINLQENSYIQSVQDAVRDLINSSHARDKQNKPGGIFLHNRTTIVEEDINLLIAIARLVIYGDNGILKSQIKDEEENIENHIELLSVENKKYSSIPGKVILPHLHYFNGIGGFDGTNNSYVILLKDHQDTPAPWINVISNGNFGFHVSESGVAYTWNKNSRENKLTTWSNDPVMDNEGENIYIRDEITGSIWSISPKPVRNHGEYLIEHGFGYSTFKHEEYGILGEMIMFTDMNESVKICKIKLKNNTQDERKLSISYYAKLVLGVTHEQTAQYIFTGFNREKEYIYARNPYSEHFGKLICYMKALGGDEFSFTGDRKEFIGRGGSVEEPKSLKQIKLSNKVGAGYDPCIAENIKVTIASNEEREIIILFGQEENFEHIDKVVEKYSIANKAEEELNKCKDYWKKMLNTIQVVTPDKSMDLMLNGWLMYQVISCRFWARTAFYQSGGAYGFRDQLQDVMAISYLDPRITREYIIYSASKQYLEGDVQHWWHPVVESGIRTRFSDDLLWLPYVTMDYIKNTGDYSILEEEASYLEDEELKEGEDERYNVSKVSDKKGTIYEHCIKAIEKSLKFGPHNIPLMGSGDWNDGMSTVGNLGRGESVWLGWFLYSILDRFTDICMKKQDKDAADKYKELKDFIKENLENNAWDGGWYRRAYFDDGTPLGSMQNDECQIDSLSQSWSVISGAARESRRKEAMEALERNLIKDDKGIVLLLTPAFDKSTLEPGYIKGYVPGVRENGGQYTHASIWVILAMAKMGYNNKAWRTFHMINPINHSNSYLNSQVYKVEPYVMTADVYAVEPHTGRGGWSWYTGAAGWMYRTGIESILGLKFRGEKGFTIEPCVPDDWKSYNIYYTREECKYNINIVRGEDKGVWLDNNKLEDRVIPILKEGSHEVKVVI